MNRFCLMICSLSLLVVLAMTGCRRSLDTAGLTWSSQDKYEYTSTMTLPVTLTLVEIYKDEPLWTYDVPAGQSIVVDLDRKGETEMVSVSGKPATRMKWRVYDDTKDRMVDKGRMDLPGVAVMLKVTYRPAPEYPGTYQASSELAKAKPGASGDKKVCPTTPATCPTSASACESQPSTAPATGPAGELLAPR